MNPRPFVLTALVAGLLTSSASAAFHFIQIEELIGGVGGNTNAQAIQLRMRFGGQTEVQATRVRAWDATGNNPILLLDLNHSVGFNEHILLASPAFNTLMAGVSGYNSDFTLTNTIPASYLSGGKITFENDGGFSTYWSVAFGNYTGSNLGDGTNDDNFGAPFASGLPINGRQGIYFPGAATADSTSNSLDYVLTPNPATVKNNDNETFTVVPEPASMLALGAAALGGVIFIRRRRH